MSLRTVCSGWANWHLEQWQYQARKAMAAAVHHQFTPAMALKWVLTTTVPGLTRRYLLQRELHPGQTN